MYGMLYGMAWPDLQHESMAWYGMMASLDETPYATMGANSECKVGPQ